MSLCTYLLLLAAVQKAWYSFKLTVLEKAILANTSFCSLLRPEGKGIWRMFLLGTEKRERKEKYKLICLIRGKNHLEALERKKYSDNKK